MNSSCFSYMYSGQLGQHAPGTENRVTVVPALSEQQNPCSGKACAVCTVVPALVQFVTFLHMIPLSCVAFQVVQVCLQRGRLKQAESNHRLDEFHCTSLFTLQWLPRNSNGYIYKTVFFLHNANSLYNSNICTIRRILLTKFLLTGQSKI